MARQDLDALLQRAAPPNAADLDPLDRVKYVADYRQYLAACTVTPTAFYLAKPIVFFEVNADAELMPVGIQLCVARSSIETPSSPPGTAVANPKSRMRARPSEVTKTFSAFRSR